MKKRQTAKKWKFPAPKRALRDALEEAFGAHLDRLSFRNCDRAIYGRDLWPRELLRLRAGEPPEGPAAIVFAKEGGDVERAVRVARELGVPLVPYAEGSGVCGGARALKDTVVVDLKGLNRIRSFDEKSRLVRCECGVNGEKLERYLNDRGYTLGHFPSSIYTSTVGGWLSTRSAGQLSTKYGKIEDMVVSIDAVLPDGSTFTSPEVPRSAAGPDFKQLLVGAEGTLGILTAASLRVHAYPDHRRFSSFAFPDWEAAGEAVRELMQQGLRPAVVRLYDEADTQLNASHMKMKIEGILGVFVCEGERRLTDFEASALESVCAAAGGRPLGEDPALRWWTHRYDVSYNMSKVLPNAGMVLDTIEIAAVWRDLPGLYRNVRAALAKNALLVLCHLSHAYLTGASLYFSIVARSAEAAGDLALYDRIWSAAMEAAVAAGGTISHHHGVGELKAAWMEREHGPLQELYVGLKARLDPQGLFNPGKLTASAKPERASPAKTRGDASSKPPKPRNRKKKEQQ